MTTEVLFTPTTSSSGNGRGPMLHAKGGDHFGSAGHRNRRDLSVVNDMMMNSERMVATVGNGRRISDGSESAEKDSPKTMRSPRCEAFVMTGEKMLSLNPKISPCYAKMCQNQLPPTVEVDSPPPDQQQPTTLFDAIPSLHNRSCDEKRRRIKDVPPIIVPVSHSDHLLDVVKEKSKIGAFDSEGGGCGDEEDRQMKRNRGEAIDTIQLHRTLLGTEPDQTIIASEEDDEGTTPTGNGTSNRHEFSLGILGCSRKVSSLPISISHMPQVSKSTPVTPSRGICQPFVCKKHRTEVANQMGATSIGDGKNANGKWHIRQQHEKAPFTALIDSSTSTRSSADVLLPANSQQCVAYPPETIARMARHLFTHQDGIKGIKISPFLVKRDELSIRIAREFLALFNFAGLRIDVALRAFLVHVQLCGNTNEREQLLEHFSQRYFECNPTVFSSADDVQLLVSALLLLSANLHGKVRHSSENVMSCREFIDNLSHNKFEHAMLRELYVAVSERSFNCQATDSGEKMTEECVQSTSTDRKRERRFSRILSSKKRGSSTASELRAESLDGTMVDPEHQVDYKHGWLLRKSIYDADGKRTPLGRRKWQMHYVTVRGMVLYLHQNERSFSSVGRYVIFRNCILLHHALAEPCCDYTKRRNIFRLRTAQLGESLFQTSECAEVQCWCDAINYVAAAFSTPALPTPVGASGLFSFYRPHLPSTATHLSIPDELRAHEQQLEEIALNLARLREKAPSLKARGKVVHEYFYKERFLETEMNRYSVYISILRDKLVRASSVLHCGDSFTSNVILLSCKKTAPDGGNSSNFGETGRRARLCGSVASQMGDDELLDEDGTKAATVIVRQL